jgi:prepilin-type N-terminal cleavage/methylation domain-containing protein
MVFIQILQVRIMMNKNLRKNGLTLIELILVIAVLVILAAIAIPMISGFIERARISADQATLRTLNVSTIAYKYLHTPLDEDAFPGVEQDQQRMQILVNEGFLNEIIRPQQPKADFNWNTESQRWLYSVFAVAETNPANHYIFKNMSKDDLIFNTWGGGGGSSWSINDDGLFTTGSNGNDLVFLGVSKSEYTLSTKFRLGENPSDIGGFGLFFETSLNNDAQYRDSGYILQFDRGFSELIIRKRVNGSESSSQGGEILVRIGNRSTSTIVNKDIPYKTNDDWWESEKDLSLTVQESGVSGKKLVTIKLDGKDILTDFEIISDIDPANSHTGFRAWNNGAVTLYDLIVD